MGWETVALMPGLNTQITPVQGRANYVDQSSGSKTVSLRSLADGLSFFQAMLTVYPNTLTRGWIWPTLNTFLWEQQLTWTS
jgi:hypothetical protein